MTGEVVAKGGNVTHHVDLKGAEAKPIRCDFLFNKAIVESIKIGSKVKVVGQVKGSGIEYDPLAYCHLIDP